VLGTAKALQHWQPDCVDEGVCGGVFVLRRWRPPFDIQRSYRARKSAAVLVAVVAAGGGGLDDVPFRTTSAHEGELETGKHCGMSCSHLDGDPAGRPTPTTLPVSGGAEP
jgi:hypothetical protein